jgi:hypothetical protein
MFCVGIFLKIEDDEGRVIFYKGMLYSRVNNSKYLKTCRASFEELLDAVPTHDQNICK